MKLLIGAVILFSVGVLMGHNTADPEVDRVEVPKTKVIHETVTAPSQPHLPESCRQVIELAEDIDRAATDLDSYTVRQLDIFEEARIAINSGPGATTEVDEKQRELQAESAETVLLLADLQQQMIPLKSACIEDSE